MGFMGRVINKPVLERKSQIQLHLNRTVPYSSECIFTGVRHTKVSAILRDLEGPTNCRMAGEGEALASPSSRAKTKCSRALADIQKG